MIDKPFTKSLTKDDVRKLLNVSDTYLRQMLNVEYYKELKELGYKKTAKVLRPHVLNWLQKKIDLQPEEVV